MLNAESLSLVVSFDFYGDLQLKIGCWQVPYCFVVRINFRYCTFQIGILLKQVVQSLNQGKLIESLIESAARYNTHQTVLSTRWLPVFAPRLLENIENSGISIT
jgi:hypothetical protein